MKITFDSNQRIGEASNMIYGHFLEHFHRQVYGGIYDPTSKFADEDGFRTDVLDALRRIHIPIIRWPGGCYVSAYDWHYGVGPKRVPTFDKAWRVEESNAFGTDEFVKLCRKLGCEPYICTNAGTGTAEDMSNWVEYCNLENQGIFARERIENGYPQPHNVKYWSIGNENYGGHEMGAKKSDEWSRLVTESAKMMLRVDPTLELSAAAIFDTDWILPLLHDAGPYLDWISVHGYWDLCPDGLDYHLCDYNTAILYTGDRTFQIFDMARALLTITHLEKRVKVAVDEWNLRGWFHPHVMDVWRRDTKRHEDKDFYENEIIRARDKNDINSQYTMADAVFSANFLNVCLRNCDIVGMACFAPILNTRGAIFTHKDGIVLRPQYFVFELYTNYMKKNVLKLWAEDVPTITGSCKGTIKTVDAIDVLATFEDGGYAISAVNKDAQNTQMLTLCALRSAVTEMRIHTLNGSSCDAYNDIGHTDVGISSSDWQPYAEQIALAPHSVNVIELR